MIYTITFNPALDYIIGVDKLKMGKVNRTSKERMLPGGKGINVSIVLNNLGVSSTALGFVGGFTGQEIERLLLEQGVKTNFVGVKKGISRINIKLKADNETEVNGRGPELDDEEIKSFFQKLNDIKDGDFLVLGGSVPVGVTNSIYSDILNYISEKDINIVVDAEKELLEKTLKYKPFLIKPNHIELGAFFDKTPETKEEVAEYAKTLQKSGARNVFVSMAKDGGVFVAETGEVFFGDAPCGTVVNSTGAGDSAVAGFLSEYIKQGNYYNAFLMGLCTGSASAFSEYLATKEEAESLYNIMKK